jgi:hypothetical protein
MRKLLFAAVAGASVLFALAAGSIALADGNGGKRVKAKLSGYNEDPASISTVARGEFKAKINKSTNTIDYTLTYSGIEGGTVSAAHIHFGQVHQSGGVSAFLCSGGDKPACPSPGGTVTGVIDAADVIGPAGQGIAAGQMDELLRAIRAGVTYVNVHSTPTYAGGEIRGQIKGGGDDDD